MEKKWCAFSDGPSDFPRKKHSSDNSFRRIFSSGYSVGSIYISFVTKTQTLIVKWLYLSNLYGFESEVFQEKSWTFSCSTLQVSKTYPPYFVTNSSSGPLSNLLEESVPTTNAENDLFGWLTRSRTGHRPCIPNMARIFWRWPLAPQHAGFEGKHTHMYVYTNIYNIYNYIYMGVSKNNGTTKSSILIGFSIISHPFWGTPIFGNTHIYIYKHIRPHEYVHIEISNPSALPSCLVESGLVMNGLSVVCFCLYGPSGSW